MRTVFAPVATSALVLSLCGCGGGAQLSAPAAPSEKPVTPPPATAPTGGNFETPEYDFSTAAKESNAIQAWQNGATGKGIKIGFVDTGLYTSNPDFAGKIDPASRDIVGDRPMGDDYGHGTALASIAAAAQDGNLIEGVAYDATIVMMRVDKPGSCTPSCEYVDIAKGITAAADAGSKVINLSIGADPSGDIIDAVKTAAHSGVIFVVSAGNNGLSNPSDFAKAIAAAAPGQVIVAGALGRDLGNGSIDYNQLWSGSNKAGSFENWYLGAPGYYVNAASKNGWSSFTGTSFAAPALAGAVALLLQAFPNLSPKDVVQILLTTADDLGTTGADTTYGEGRLNIGKAFQPVGATVLAGSEVAVSTVDNGSAPSAAGDAIQRGDLRAVVLDAYSRSYSVNLARTLKPAVSARPLERALSSSLQSSFTSVAGLGVGLAVADPLERKLGFDSPNVGVLHAQDLRPRFLSFVANRGSRSSFAFSINGSASTLARTLGPNQDHGFFINGDVLADSGFDSQPLKSAAVRHDFGPAALTLSGEKGEVERGYLGDDHASYRLNRVTIDKALGRSSLSFSFAKLSENRTVLGGRLGRVFGEAGATSLFVDASSNWNLHSGWSLNVQARRGWTQFSDNSLITSAYSVSAQKIGIWGANDQLSIALSQPLRVESGGLSMSLPDAYSNKNGSATYAPAYLSLSPSGREIVGEVSYLHNLKSGYTGMSFYARRQPGHLTAAAPDFGAALQLKLRL